MTVRFDYVKNWKEFKILTLEYFSDIPSEQYGT